MEEDLGVRPGEVGRSAGTAPSPAARRPARPRAVRLGLLGASTLGLAVLAAACSGGPASAPATSQPTASPRSAVAAAYDKTVSAGTARVAVVTTVSGISGATAPITVSGTGMVDLDGREGELTMSVPGQGSVTVRFVGSTLYVSLPPEARNGLGLSPGKSWASLDLRALAHSQAGVSLSQATASSEDPTQFLSYLRAVSSDGVHVVGTATLHGTPTTAYAADVDLAAYATRVDPDAAPSIQALERQIGASKLPVVVWVDGQGRLCQLVISFGAPGSSGESGSAGVRLTLQVYDYGVPVQVVAPPADETQDVTGQVAGTGAGGTQAATGA